MRARRYQPGVISPYTVTVNPYPTRYHGGIWTRPVFGMPYVQSPQSVFKPDDFYPMSRYPWPQPNRAQSGLGQDPLSMPPETLAKLKACNTDCDNKYGVPSGAPNPIAISACLATCAATYPPTVAVPGGGTITPPPLTTVQTPDFPSNAQQPAQVPMTTASVSTGSKKKLLLAAGAVAAAAALGFYVYKKRKAD